MEREMTTRKRAAGTEQNSRKLALKKQTLKDLAPKTKQSDNVRGGFGRVCTYAQSGCAEDGGG